MKIIFDYKGGSQPGFGITHAAKPSRSPAYALSEYLRGFVVGLSMVVFKKLEQAQADYPMWVAAIAKRCCEAQIAGKMGEGIEGGFVLDQPNIQVFERKPKEPKPEGEEAAKSNGA